MKESRLEKRASEEKGKRGQAGDACQNRILVLDAIPVIEIGISTAISFQGFYHHQRAFGGHIAAFFAIVPGRKVYILPGRHCF